MPVSVFKWNGSDYQEYKLVPAPLVSMGKTITSNPGRPAYATEYSISLDGTIVPNLGNPVASGSTEFNTTGGWLDTRNIDPEEITVVESNDLLDAVMQKQEWIRWVFSPSIATSGQIERPIKLKISGWSDASFTGGDIECPVYVDDISFTSDRNWAGPNSYSVALRAFNFVNVPNSGNALINDFGTEAQSSGYFVNNVTESFDIQEDAQRTMTISTSSSGNRYLINSTNKVYTISRNISAVGQPIYDSNGQYKDGLSPWQHASGYVHEYILGNGDTIDFMKIMGGKLGDTLSSGWYQANSVRQESINKEDGSYSIAETVTIYSGIYIPQATGGYLPTVPAALESVSINADVGEDGQHSISVQGTIQGLNTNGPHDLQSNYYNNALDYLNNVVLLPRTSSTAPAGTAPEEAYHPYLMARHAMYDGAWLHPVPVSFSTTRDPIAGTVGYNYSYNSRPPNIVSNSISESISISDTYPGEIISVTPVIGRNQPVLQHLGSRSEYKRSMTINIVMRTYDPEYINYGSLNTGLVTGSSNIRNHLQRALLTNKPSISHQSELAAIYDAMNPVNDPNFTVTPGKCFHSAPTENWDAKTGNYTYSVEWTYQRQS